MGSAHGRLRVALLAGTLDQGGAEKQLLYMARALLESAVDVRLYCLRKGEFHEAQFRSMGIPFVWVGRFGNPLLRLLTLILAMSRFRPHVIQSSHSFANLYAALAGRALGAVSLGALRSTLRYSWEANGFWTRWLMKMPTALIVNSAAAVSDLEKSKLSDRRRVYLVPNTIDLSDGHETSGTKSNGGIRAVFVGRLVSVKRLDRFLEAFAKAFRQEERLRGVVVGDGPERGKMEKLAEDLGLGPESVVFLGQRNDVGKLLREAGMLVLCSEEEGFPNVVLEAMAAGLPVITTSAGDAARVVLDGVTGYVVAPGDVEGMANRMVRLAQSAELRRALGSAGRKRVEQHYSFDRLAGYLLGSYREVAERARSQRLRSALWAHLSGPVVSPRQERVS